MPTHLDNNKKYGATLTPTILETNHFRDLLKSCSFNSCVVVDLDNTVIESTKEIGNDQWYAKLFEYACKTIPDQSLARRLVITILHEVQYRITVKAVEPTTAQIIKILQDIGIPVLALTSRGEEIIDSTLRQMKDVGIDFSKYWGQGTFALPVPDAPRPVYFKDGIIFCNGFNKGPCLNTFFDITNYHPVHCVMADDKKENLLQVQDAICDDGVAFTGIRYGYLDNKVTNLDMHKATTELIEISDSFSSEGQHAVEKLRIRKYIEHRDRSNSILSQSFFGNNKLSACAMDSQDEMKYSRRIIRTAG